MLPHEMADPLGARPMLATSPFRNEIQIRVDLGFRLDTELGLSEILFYERNQVDKRR